jgi:hypothetical protein
MLFLKLENLSLELHAVAFFLSPSLFLFFCKFVAQCVCSRPREIDPGRALRFFYVICILSNLPSIYVHLFRGVADGRAIILDFIGMCMLFSLQQVSIHIYSPLAYSPSKFQLCYLDLFNLLLQLLVVTISYETSVYATDDADATDLLLPQSPELMRNDSPSLLSSQSTPSYPTNTTPIVVDLRQKAIAAHFHHAPHPSRAARYDSLLPIPNSSLTRMRISLRQIQRRINEAATRSGRETRMPGAMDTTQDR